MQQLISHFCEKKNRKIFTQCQRILYLYLRTKSNLIIQVSVADWDLYFINEMPGSSLDEAHKTLASELEILLNHVNKDSREWCKAKAIKKQLKVCFNLLYRDGVTVPCGLYRLTGIPLLA